MNIMNKKKDVKDLIKKLESLELSSNEGMTLAEFRECLQLSQKSLGEILGLSRDTIAQYEIGRRTPRFTVRQIKVLEILLQEIGKTWQDLADDLSNRRTQDN